MSIHLSTTPTRKVILQELERLLGPLHADVAAEWETKYLLQRRDAEQLDQQHRSAQPAAPAQPALSPSLPPSSKAVVEVVETEGVNTVAAINGHHGEQSNGDKQAHSRRSKGKRKRGEQDAALHADRSPAHSSPSSSPVPAAAAEPKHVSLLSPPLVPHSGLEEIALDDDDDHDEPAPPRPSSSSSSSLLSPSPSPPSTLQLLSALTFLLPDRDPSFYSSWPVVALSQRIVDAYHTALSSHLSAASTPLTSAWLFALAHLLSPILLPSPPLHPAWVDRSIQQLLLSLALHVRACIERGDLDDGDGIDEARLALSEVRRARDVIGLEEVDDVWMRQWIDAVTPAAPAPAAATHPNGASSSRPAPLPASTSSTSSASDDDDDDDDSSSRSASPAPRDPARTVASVTHLSLPKAVALVKPRFIVLDAANIGRWSGSGDPSTEVTVNTTGDHHSLPSHLQSLPTSIVPTRQMIRLDSWQIAAAVLAVESQLHTPALCCLPEQFIRRPTRFGVRDVDLLLLLQKAGKLHRLPSGADDDTQLIALTNEAETWLVTNDNLRDHVYSGTVSKDWVGSRLIKYYTVEYPRIGVGRMEVGGAGEGLKTMEEVKERGSVCLIEPAAMRRNIHAKEQMAADAEEGGDQQRSQQLVQQPPPAGYPQAAPGYATYPAPYPYQPYYPPPPPGYALPHELHAEWGGGGYAGAAPGDDPTQYPLIVPPSLVAQYAGSPYSLYVPPPAPPAAPLPLPPSPAGSGSAEGWSRPALPSPSSSSSPFSSSSASSRSRYPHGAFIPPNAPPPVIFTRH